jgi:hypothetical protein
MTDLKAKPTTDYITTFINKIENKTRQADSKIVLKMMQDITKSKATLW